MKFLPHWIFGGITVVALIVGSFFLPVISKWLWTAAALIAAVVAYHDWTS